MVGIKLPVLCVLVLLGYRRIYRDLKVWIGRLICRLIWPN